MTIPNPSTSTNPLPQTPTKPVCPHCQKIIRGYGWTLNVPFRIGEPGCIVLHPSEQEYPAFTIVCKKHFLAPTLKPYEILQGDVARKIVEEINGRSFIDLVKAKEFTLAALLLHQPKAIDLAHLWLTTEDREIAKFLNYQSFVRSQEFGEEVAGLLALTYPEPDRTDALNELGLRSLAVDQLQQAWVDFARENSVPLPFPG